MIVIKNVPRDKVADLLLMILKEIERQRRIYGQPIPKERVGVHDER